MILRFRQSNPTDAFDAFDAFDRLAKMVLDLVACKDGGPTGTLRFLTYLHHYPQQHKQQQQIDRRAAPHKITRNHQNTSNYAIDRYCIRPSKGSLRNGMIMLEHCDQRVTHDVQVGSLST